MNAPVSTSAPLGADEAPDTTRSMQLGALRLPLTEAQIDEFGRELDALRDEVMDSRGERDRRYILRLIKTQRMIALGGRVTMLASLPLMPLGGPFLALLAVGAAMLGLAKILENMEIGHNILHAQWDWMKDPEIQSSTWEWDHMSPSDRWMHSHNVEHHTWTNVLGKDLDIGYGLLRVTPLQRWKPRHRFQPIFAFLLMLLFEPAIAIHERAINEARAGRKTWAEIRPLMQHIGRKVKRQAIKDFLAWPALAALLALPLLSMGGPLWAFLGVAAANLAANVMRNIWTFSIIFCGHFPDGTHNFTQEQVANETPARWYLRQLLGSANIGGGKLFHILSGNLSHQIEHHLFPDMPSNRYPEIAPRVRALALRYGLPYNTASFARQLGTTWRKLFALSRPGPAPAPAGA